MTRKVHDWGNVAARSNGDDTDCGAGGDASRHKLAEFDSEVTCKKCLRLRKLRAVKQSFDN